MFENELDPFGEAFKEFTINKDTTIRIHRDDGYSTDETIDKYFLEYEDWPEIEKKALEFVKERVLDVGCGPGRHLLWLQQKGLICTGIDISPLAVEVAKSRGVKHSRVMDLQDLKFVTAKFSTVLLMGNNIGLCGSYERTKQLLNDVYKITTTEGVIIGTTRDPLETENPKHLNYHRMNREKGNPPGLARIRFEFNGKFGEWFNLLLLTPEELEEVVKSTGWEIKQLFRSTTALEGLYSVVLSKREKI